MRQAGVIASAGIIALETMIDRLAEDHQRAEILAEGLAQISGVVLTKGSPNTNMVFFKLSPDIGIDNNQFINLMKNNGVLINDTNDGEIRLVSHNDVDDQAIEVCIKSVRQILNN